MARKKKGEVAENNDTETKGLEEVQVNPNTDGEATNNTTQEGQEDPVENTESIPQNGATEVETTPPTNPVAEKADEARTEEDVKFADESNPNQKARNSATDGAEVDQDGNPRTGGYSYGVSADDVEGTVYDEQNAPGETAENSDAEATASNDLSYLNPALGESQNDLEASVEDQQKLEEELSEPENGIRARVITSAGGYVKVKWFWNNKPLGLAFKTRNYKDGDAQKHLADLKEQYGLNS